MKHSSNLARNQQKARAELLATVTQQLDGWQELDGQKLTNCLTEIDEALVRSKLVVD